MTSEQPTVAEHLQTITVATDVFAASARRAGLGAAVLTCPGWAVRDLLAHQGMVHRWATAIVRGEDPSAIDSTVLEAAGLAHTDPAAWLEAGATDLVRAIEDAPDDLDALVFLRQAPPARRFWARRQCHETTVHALDAVSAREQRLLTAADAWFDDHLALDGIDELLVGFWQRRARGLRSESPYTAAVSAGAGTAWLLEVGPEGTVTRRLGPSDGIPAGTRRIDGSPLDLYLALWNRGGTVEDPTGLLPTWRERAAITW